MLATRRRQVKHAEQCSGAGRAARRCGERILLHALERDRVVVTQIAEPSRASVASCSGSPKAADHARHQAGRSISNTSTGSLTFLSVRGPKPPGWIFVLEHARDCAGDEHLSPARERAEPCGHVGHRADDERVLRRPVRRRNFRRCVPPRSYIQRQRRSKSGGAQAARSHALPFAARGGRNLASGIAARKYRKPLCCRSAHTAEESRLPFMPCLWSG